MKKTLSRFFINITIVVFSFIVYTLVVYLMKDTDYSILYLVIFPIIIGAYYFKIPGSLFFGLFGNILSSFYYHFWFPPMAEYSIWLEITDSMILLLIGFIFGIISRQNQKNKELVGQLSLEIETRTEAEKKLKQTLGEKDTLLSEINHRVKNNLQLISSLLKLQERKIKESKVTLVFQDIRRRIQALALVHENLHLAQSLSKIRLVDHIPLLVSQIQYSFEALTGSVDVKLDVEDITLDIIQATPLSMILNELITNSYKHAFIKGRDKSIMISIKNIDGATIQVIVKDNGVGLPEDFDLKKHGLLGLQIVEKLIQGQLYGNWQYISDNGTIHIIEFKKD